MSLASAEERAGERAGAGRPSSPGVVRGAEPGRMQRHSLMLSASAGLTGLVSYACTLLMTHLLPAAAFTQFAAGQMLLGVVGIVSNALVPLPLAGAVRRFARRTPERRTAVAFAVLVSLLLGAVSALVTGAVTATFAPPVVAVAVAVSSIVLFAVTTSLGWLQGEARYTHYAVLSVVEVALRLGFSLFAVAQGWGTVGVLLGFAVGAVVLLAVPPALFTDLAWRPSVLTDRVRWAETGSIALTQLVVASLVAADVVFVALVGHGSPETAGFQALSTLAKGPVYIAAGTVLVTFPLLRTVGARVDEVLDLALRSFARLALFAAVVLATVPPALVLFVLPARYAGSLPLLPWLALAGFGYAVVTVLTIVLLGLRAHVRNCLGLLASAVLLPVGMALGWRLGGVPGLAVGAATGALAATAALLVLTVPVLPRSIGGALPKGVLLTALLAAALTVASPHPLVWLAVAGGAGLVVVARPGGRQRPRHARVRAPFERRRV